MKFQSYDFLFIFLPITIFIYYLFGKKNSAIRNMIIICASYIFYSLGDLSWAFLLMCSSIIDFNIGKLLFYTKKEALRKILLFMNVVINISFLACFKYWDWFVNSIIQLPSLEHNIPIPAGISFYTFQSMGYIIDIYRKEFRANCKWWEYCSFVSFFPQLVAGPIERASHLINQLNQKNIFVSKKSIEFGIYTILYGLCKKLVFADNLANIVESCKERISEPGIGLILVTSFSFQIYCDFSGYTDIARGTARLFGINLMRNFLTPYWSLTPSEFWRRWHISLSSWVKDYIYIPLGGNRASKLRSTFNLIFTMLIIGIWHGTGIFYFLWGLFHGIALAIHKITKWDKFIVSKFGNITGTIINRLIMTIIILYSWLLFISKTPSEYNNTLKSLYSLFQFYNLQAFIHLGYGCLLFSLPIIIMDYLAYKRHTEFVDLYKSASLRNKVISIIVCFYLIILFATRSTYDFIYFNF